MNSELQRQLSERKARLARFAAAGNPSFDRPINLRPVRVLDLPPAPAPEPAPVALPAVLPFQAPLVTLANNSPFRLPLHIITIQGAVCEHFGLTRADLIGPIRTRRLVRPRQIAMFLTKDLLPHMSLLQIGRKFGGRDHTTTLHGIRTIKTMIKFGNAEVAAHVEAVREKIKMARGEA